MPNKEIWSLDRDAYGSLQGQLKAEILRRIRSGLLRPGDRLPPSRGLADDIGVNRGTVSAVYDELRGEGVLEGQVGRGTFVSGERAGDPASIELEDGTVRWQDHFSDPAPAGRERALLAEAAARGGGDVISFAGLVPDQALFPTEAFRSSLNAVLKEQGARLLAYGAPEGDEAFLEFLREYLVRERGVRVAENELLVVNGSQQALDLIGRAFLRPGDTVLVEEPSYHGAMEIFRSYGARLVGVPVDEEGVRTDALEGTLARERPKLVYVMPTFQNPTGRCLSPERRGTVVALARRFQVPTVEDDFDGELSFDGPPPPPLKSQPDSEPVIYTGTPSKMLFPGLRIGWMAAPEPVVRRLSAIKQRGDLSGSPLLQAALARFARSGGLARHMDRVREAYGERLRRLLDALGRHMPEGVTWTRPRGGLSLLLTLPRGIDTSELLEEAAREGVLYSPGRLFFLNDGARSLRLSYGNVPTGDVDDGVRRLAGVLGRAMQRKAAVARVKRGVALPPV